MEKSDIDIFLKKHAPNNDTRKEKILLEQILKDRKPIEMWMIIGDIRKSTTLMKEACSMEKFAETMNRFVKKTKELSSTHNAWFDKFTGDGFIIYLIVDDEKIEPVLQMFEFCREIINWFPSIVEEFRNNSKNFPMDAGTLSLGIDKGECSLVNIAGDLTVVGPAIVGATRMVSAAKKPYQILMNVRAGSEIYNKRKALQTERIQIEEIGIETKEYNEVLAYSLNFDND